MRTHAALQALEQSDVVDTEALCNRAAAHYELEFYKHCIKDCNEAKAK